MLSDTIKIVLIVTCPIVFFALLIVVGLLYRRRTNKRSNMLLRESSLPTHRTSTGASVSQMNGFPSITDGNHPNQAPSNALGLTFSTETATPATHSSPATAAISAETDPGSDIAIRARQASITLPTFEEKALSIRRLSAHPMTDEIKRINSISSSIVDPLPSEPDGDALTEGTWSNTSSKRGSEGSIMIVTEIRDGVVGVERRPSIPPPPPDHRSFAHAAQAEVCARMHEPGSPHDKRFSRQLSYVVPALPLTGAATLAPIRTEERGAEEVLRTAALATPASASGHGTGAGSNPAVVAVAPTPMRRESLRYSIPARASVALPEVESLPGEHGAAGEAESVVVDGVRAGDGSGVGVGVGGTPRSESTASMGSMGERVVPGQVFRGWTGFQGSITPNPAPAVPPHAEISVEQVKPDEHPRGDVGQSHPAAAIVFPPADPLIDRASSAPDPVPHPPSGPAAMVPSLHVEVATPTTSLRSSVLTMGYITAPESPEEQAGAVAAKGPAGHNVGLAEGTLDIAKAPGKEQCSAF